MLCYDVFSVPTAYPTEVMLSCQACRSGGVVEAGCKPALTEPPSNVIARSPAKGRTTKQSQRARRCVGGTVRLLRPPEADSQ